MGRFQLDQQQLLPLVDLAQSAEEQVPFTRRIYCNRDLRLDLVDVVGFDMDYTLAVYLQEAMDRLSIEATARKLVARGYPASLLDMSMAINFPIRGLLVDKKLGNLLKTDRYRYPKKAYHGTRELSSEDRKRIYANKRIRPGTRRYHAIDTLYALSEVTVYAAVIDALDHDLFPLDYEKLFDDVRASIDEAHQDGSIKDLIQTHPERFLVRDPQLGPTLHRLRSAGKKLFLLTNSGPVYTDALMRYLLGDGEHGDERWSRYFDIVITEASKPSFFTGCDPFTNVDDGQPVVSTFERGEIYRGGSLREFERLTGFTGDQVLYVGDHIYGDVLRTKKESAWRTLMIIQELGDELSAIERFTNEIARLHQLDVHRYELLDSLREQQTRMKSLTRKLELGAEPEVMVELDAARLRCRRAIDRMRARIKAIELEHLTLERTVDRGYHPYWGSMFKAESELSSFGEQVERYACLYTDRVSNLMHYSPSHFFRGPRHRMAHEL